MNRPQKTAQKQSIKTRSVKKLDTISKSGSQELNTNRLGIPRRPKNIPNPEDQKPSAPYPEKRGPIWFVLILVALFLCLAHAEAQTYLMTNGNSSVSADVGSSAGIDNWAVEGQNQLNTGSFWYRIGSSGTASSIDTIGTPTVSQPGAGSLVTTYQNTQLSLQVTYSVVGGATGSGTSDLAEQINIQNLTSAPLTFSFFQYSGFSLGGILNQTAQLGQNRQGKYNEATVTSANVSLAETIDGAFSPGANRGETALGNSTINNLKNTPGYDLNNNLSAGPGGATWALEWNASIATGGSLIISEDLNIQGVTLNPVPEPSLWSLASFGLIALGTYKRYFRRS